ncbi:MAG: nucleotidyltransferase domain-containing protein [Candidatus Thorarchaeota archaeon]
MSYEILKYLFEEKSSSFSNLQNFVIFNPRTLSKKLKNLLDTKLLRKKGNIYEITERGLTFFELFQNAIFLLHNFDPSIESLNVPLLMKLALQEYIKILVTEFKDNLVSIVLFGSFSTGSWSDTSDIDLAIFFNKIPAISRIFEQFTLCRRQFRATSNYRLVTQNNLPFRVQHLPFERKPATFHNLFPDLITTGIALYDPFEYYVEFKEQVLQIIKQKNLVKIENVSGSQYWKRLTEGS